MNRNQFLQLAIIAPIAGFFGIKAMTKPAPMSEIGLADFNADEALKKLKRVMGRYGIKDMIFGENLHKADVWLKDDHVYDAEHYTITEWGTSRKNRMP